ncbi:hypothetical protein TIFTF001_000453 [Ficus carica]|uniref:Pentatricopeptide repeat-containing protein n=1 Tax=Ficus carica TaxID=3494 RepID=A0AA88CN49_FICCA|nr:hypothetical protein TIFTF001_000453 [Ficus carica]
MVKRPPLEALSLFNETTTTTNGFEHTPQTIYFIVDHLLSFNLLTHAQSLIAKLLSGRISSSLFTPSSLLRHLTHPHNPSLTSSRRRHLYEAIVGAQVLSQSPEDAVLYLTQMVEERLVPGSFTFNNVLSSLVKSKRFEKALWVFNEFRDRTELDEYSFGIMIKSCCEAGDLEDFGFWVFWKKWVGLRML